MNASQILTADEIQQAIADLNRRAKRSLNSRINRIVFRLSCCCGLRRCEISGLVLRDIVLSASRPVIKVRKDNTKGMKERRRSRLVPLWWDAGTLADIKEWVEWRTAETGDVAAPVVFSPRTNRSVTVGKISIRWRTAIRCLGPERVKQVSCHAGRHSFVSHALYRGRSLAEVRDAVGHGSIATTSIYAHAISDENVPDIFGNTKGTDA